MHCNKTDINPQNIKDELNESINHYTYVKNITFNFHFENTPLFADFDLLCIVLQNFLFNAIDAIEEGECEEGIVYYTAAEGVLYANTDQGKMLVMAPKKLAGKLVVPDDVAAILDSAFSSCTMLTEVQLPSSLWWIGGASFRFCSSLEKINIPENVTSIGQRAFEGCGLLSSIEFPQKLEYIQKYAFNGCFGLTSLTIPKSVKYIGEYAFNGCTSLKFIYIEPDSVEIASHKIVFPYDAVLICPKSRINDKGEVVLYHDSD